MFKYMYLYFHSWLAFSVAPFHRIAELIRVLYRQKRPAVELIIHFESHFRR